MKALDIALLLTFATLLAFVGTVIFFNWHEKEVQDSLITAFLAIIGAEIATCGGITIFKNRKQNQEADDHGEQDGEDDNEHLRG